MRLYCWHLLLLKNAVLSRNSVESNQDKLNVRGKKNIGGGGGKMILKVLVIVVQIGNELVFSWKLLFKPVDNLKSCSRKLMPAWGCAVLTQQPLLPVGTHVWASHHRLPFSNWWRRAGDFSVGSSGLFQALYDVLCNAAICTLEFIFLHQIEAGIRVQMWAPMFGKWATAWVPNSSQ